MTGLVSLAINPRFRCSKHESNLIRMATHQSAVKRIRRNARRNRINGAWRARVRTFVKMVESAIITGDKNAAMAAFKASQPELARGAQVGVVHRNAMRRKLSRLSNRIRAM